MQHQIVDFLRDSVLRSIMPPPPPSAAATASVVLLVVVDKDTPVAFFNKQFIKTLRTALVNKYGSHPSPAYELVFALQSGDHRGDHRCDRIVQRVERAVPTTHSSPRIVKWRLLADLLAKIGRYRLPFSGCVLTANISNSLVADYLANYGDNLSNTKLINFSENVGILQALFPSNKVAVDLASLVVLMQTFQTVVNSSGKGKLLTQVDYGALMLVSNSVL